MTTRVVHLNREHYDVYIGRAGHGKDGYFGNPFPPKTSSHADRDACLKQFKDYFIVRMTEPNFARRALALRGQVLGCFCKPKKCHGDIISEYVDSAVCANCDAPATTIRNKPEFALLCDDCEGA